MNKQESKYYEDGMNKNTYEVLFEDFKKLDMDDESKRKSYLLIAIESYTRIREKSIFKRLATKYFSHKVGVDLSKIRFNKERSEYEISVDGETYNFHKLSKILGNKESKKELESNRRYGKCHERSEILLGGITKTSILTGYVRDFNIKYLHSVVEYNSGNNYRIIDWTKNLIMDKDAYIKLTNFEEIEHISDVEFFKIIQKINFLVGKNMVTHLIFGRELSDEIERKGLIYEGNPEIKKQMDKLIQSRIQKNKRIDEMENRRKNRQQKELEEER